MAPRLIINSPTNHHSLPQVRVGHDGILKAGGEKMRKMKFKAKLSHRISIYIQNGLYIHFSNS